VASQAVLKDLPQKYFDDYRVKCEAVYHGTILEFRSPK
jgi:hypothetical protein